MRRRVAIVGLAGALAVAQTAVLAQAEAAPAAPPAAPPAAAVAPNGPASAPAPRTAPVRDMLTDPVLGYYPAGARTAGLEGQAVIRCKRDEHLAMTGCTLVSETPAGQGFGAAALAMAAKSPPNPKLLLKDAAAEPAADTTIQFTLRPPYIAPDVTRMAHIVKSAQIVTKPTDAQVQAAYPPRALDNQIQGGAVIECAVSAAGKLADCHVFNEDPTGYGFGQAALDLAADFSLKPRLIDGEPVGGSPVRISVGFAPNDPTAPLTLQTKPGGDQRPNDGGIHAGGLPPLGPVPTGSLGSPGGHP